MEPITVHPRRAGQPQPDVLGLLLAHRTMIKDLHRLPVLVTAIARGETELSRRRATAVAAYLEDFCDSIHHHHAAEDDILWPVLEQSAGPHVDLTELSDDHRVLDPKLERIRAGAAALRDPGSAPESRTALAADLTELRDTLVEHITDEEQSIVPVIQRYMSVEDWRTVVAAIQKNGAKVAFEAPRVINVATPQEIAVMKAEIPLPLRFVVWLAPKLFARRERLVFGAQA